MFFMLQALSLKYRFESSKHAQLIGWFNKRFIYTSKIEVKFSKIITKGHKLRTKGDYATVYDPNIPELAQMFEEIQESIVKIEQFLNSRKE